jgi:hypothetical protein
LKPFFFTRIQYTSGDWETDQRMPSNLMHSLVEYTTLPVEMGRTFGPKALQKIPNTHPIYTCFFKFPEGPPTTSFELNGWGDDLVHDYLKGITINGRLGLLYSNKDYGCEWDYDFRNKRFLAEDNTKFGVNIVTYALTA